MRLPEFHNHASNSGRISPHAGWIETRTMVTASCCLEFFQIANLIEACLTVLAPLQETPQEVDRLTLPWQTCFGLLLKSPPQFLKAKSQLKLLSTSSIQARQGRYASARRLV